MDRRKIKGVPMRSALDSDGCKLVLRFFHMLLQIKALNKANKRIDIGAALDIWNKQEFGRAKIAITGFPKEQMDRLHRTITSHYDSRREWMIDHQGTATDLATEASRAWGITRSGAYQWLLHEQVRQGRVSA